MLGLSAISSTAIAALFQPNSVTPSVATQVRSGPVETIFEINSTIRILGEFANVASGVYQDPGTTLVLLLLTPAGVLNVITNITYDDTGLFHYDFSPSESGVWIYKWRGAGQLSATSPDLTFTVKPSVIIAG